MVAIPVALSESTRSKVPNDSTSPTLDGDNTSDLENDILRCRPSTNLSGELNTNDLKPFEFPHNDGCNINSISASNTISNHAETSGIGS
ncbi:hypothetical protein CPB83DRAFT_919559, partial [Crepidotus variabilis]